MKLAVIPGLLLFTLSGQNSSRAPLAEPSIAPDRAEVAFVSGSDIWSAPLAGGEARLLVSHPATESRPVFSPDGKRLAFTSTRTGNGDVYVLDLGTGDLKRLTFHEGSERVDNWSRDGRYVYFTSGATDIGGMGDVFRVSADGGTALPVSGDRYASEYFAAPAPAGDTLALTAKGIVGGQWWRKGHSHIDESEIWLRHENEPARYERVTEGEAKSAWPMWSSDGKRLYFMSDRTGAENIWEKPIGGGQPRQITKFTDGRVLWPSIAYDGKAIVFERDFGIWSLDVGSGKAAAIQIALRGAPAGLGATRTTTTSFRDLALSPDGKKLAFAARGDIFAAGVRDTGPATRLTDTPALEANVVWAADNRRVVYTSDRNGVNQLFLYDLSRNTESQLTKTNEIDSSPFWSPDGKQIAFLRGGRKLMLLDVAAGTERELATASFSLPPIEASRTLVWSPDSKWIAYAASGERGFRNVTLVPVAGGAAVRASYLPNAGSNTVSWSPDGKYILFDTSQRTEPGRIARVDLIPRTPRFREDQFRELFRDDPSLPQQPAPAQPGAPTPAGTPEPPPATAAPKPAPPRIDVQVVSEGIRNRLTLLPTGIDIGWQTISPDGKSLLMIASAAGQTNLWLYSLDELSRETPVARQLTSTSGFKSDAWFTPDNRDVYFLENGRIQSINVENRQTRAVSLTADVDIDFAKDKQEVFRQAWGYLNEHFYDEKFHGVDWSAQRARVAPYVEGARTPDELRRVLGLMIGELNASHLGISGPAPAPLRTGTLGLRFNRAEYESNGRLKITEVIRLGPADVAGIKTGQYIVAVDRTAVAARTSLDELLEHKEGKRVVVTVAEAADGAGRRDVPIRPISGAQEKTLLYRHWVEDRREYVHRVSGGRLGYVHMYDMSSNSLDQLYIDLDTENQGREGVVVDVRNNNGGFVNVYALDVLARRPFLNMTVRGLPAAPARSMLGQRALERPTILVVNQHSLSDAEDFTEGYRSMGLGKVVGERTAGWIIYTWNVQLMDGSMLRLPRTRITDMRGNNMERNPRPVDIAVTRPVGESYSGVDSQLDTAVKELLKQIDGAKRTQPSSGGGY